jgi:ParB family chromosome partitioning protein
MDMQVNGSSINLKVIPLHKIKPYENNVRIHPVRQLEGLANSISQFGFKSVVVIDKDNTIIAGHARYEAAAALGFQELLCIVANDLTDEQTKAYRILDNKISEMGATDAQALAFELTKIPDFDLTPFNIEFPKLKLELTKAKEIEEENTIIVCPKCKHEFNEKDI